MRKLYVRKLWGGFVNGELSTNALAPELVTFGDGNVAVYSSREKALREYEDVRPVEVRELPAKRKRRE